MHTRRRKPGDVELNLAAMLDMAFQLLTFFILTFKTAPVEGQISLRMPLPQPVAGVGKVSPGDNFKNHDELIAFPSLVITVMGNEDGQIASMSVGPSAVGNLNALDTLLSRVLTDEGSGFDQVVLQIDSRLQYNELMRVLDVCTRQTLAHNEPLSKLSLVELPQG